MLNFLLHKTCSGTQTPQRVHYAAVTETPPICLDDICAHNVRSFFLVWQSFLNSDRTQRVNLHICQSPRGNQLQIILQTGRKLDT